MKFSESKWCVLVVLTGLIFMGVHSHATPALPPASAPSNNKVIVYPTSTETIDQLKQTGITRVRSYGSYWLVQATDAQVAELTHLYGTRAVKDNDLNEIRLTSLTFDTTAGDPIVPADLRQVDRAAKYLRLVQLQGPVVPQWLHVIESSGARVISYVPNNAYLVFVDAAAEKKLEQARGLDGPIQWIGSYHPYYKIARELRNLSGTQPIKVRVAIVEQAQVESGVYAMGTTLATRTHSGQEIVEMNVLPSAVEKMAQLADVLWIQKVVRQVPLDEVQDLLITTQTNAPGFGPSVTMGITNYLDFLTNTVGGGQAAFMDQAAYPVVDVADTGLDVCLGLDQQHQPVVANPAFSDPNGRTRVAYLEPGLNGYFPAPEVVMNGELGCPGLNDNFNNNDIVHSADDFYEHGTFVASIISGYDVQTNSFTQLIFSTIVTQTFTAVDSNVLAGCGGTATTGTGVFTFATQPCPLTTNLVVSCPTTPGPVFQTLDLATEIIHTQVVFSTEDHVDPSGFQLGLGVSPFGSVGASRIWSQNAHVNSANQVVIDSTSICINTFTGLVASAYFNGARIQNNSWSDALNTDGLNGGEYTSDSFTFDALVRDALFVGTSNNVPGPSPLNQEFIVVFAANNLLGDGGANGSVGGFGETRLTAPSTAKNVITVGSSDSVRSDGSGCAPDSQETNSLALPPFTAYGPTIDGRFKPEIVAPGTTIYGATSELALYNDPVIGINHLVNAPFQVEPQLDIGQDFVAFSQILTNLYGCTNFVATTAYNATFVGVGLYECDSGSSFAAPAVSGAIQLMWWYFQNRLTNELGIALLQPSPAMAKAYLCNAARYLTFNDPAYGTMDTLPSNAQGMGELDLLRMFDGVPRVIRDESSPRAIDSPLITTNPAVQQTYFSQSGQSYELSGQITNNYQPFRVTLTWTDPPGIPGAAQEVVNNLGLEVTIGGVTYNGNNFSENVSVTNNHIDRINNMQSVFLNPTNMLNGILAVSNGAPWKVTVRALNIAGTGVPNVGEPPPGGSNTLNQDFALVVYNAATNTLSDVPNMATNNACQTAMFITEFPFSFTNTLSTVAVSGTNGYNKVMPSPTAGPGGVEEFFKIPLPTPGVTFTVSTAGTSFNNILSVWEVPVVPQAILVRGDCGALTELVSTNQSEVSFTADGTNDYYIVVEPASDGPGGTMVLSVGATTVPITISPAGLSFGNQVAGTTSTNQTANYLNGTTVPVNVQTVSITGSNAADFAITSDGCQGAILNPNIGCGVTVAFSPATNDLGLLQANLVFTDDQIGSPRSIPLTGTATAPAPLVCLSTGTSLDFSNVVVGTNSTVQSVTITNCGSTLLDVSNVALSGTGSGDFSVSQNCTGGGIAAGGTCMLQVTFTPSRSGTRQASLIITHDATGSPTTISVQGVGVAPAALVCSSSSSLNFGNLGVNTTSTVQSITITNCGTAPLVINSVAISAGDTGEFIIQSSTCSNVPVGSFCTVDLVYAPTNGGPRSATLAIAGNFAGSPQSIALSGSGALSQPDVAIGKTDKLKKMIGFGTINTTGIGQEISQNVHRQTPTAVAAGKHGVKYYVAIQNVGSANDQFTVQSTQISGGQGWTVNYFIGANPKENVDITATVNAGTFVTGALGPGAVTSAPTMILVEVFADKTLVTKGTTAIFTLTFTSASDPASEDAVRITAVAR